MSPRHTTCVRLYARTHVHTYTRIHVRKYYRAHAVCSYFLALKVPIGTGGMGE